MYLAIASRCGINPRDHLRYQQSLYGYDSHGGPQDTLLATTRTFSATYISKMRRIAVIPICVSSLTYRGNAPVGRAAGHEA